MVQRAIKHPASDAKQKYDNHRNNYFPAFHVRSNQSSLFYPKKNPVIADGVDLINLLTKSRAKNY